MSSSRAQTGSPIDNKKETSSLQEPFSVPSIELPKGGGAIKGIEEKFQVNAVNGTLSFTIPLPLSSSRHGAAPSLGLNYNSGNGNGPFGIGWNVDVPSIGRKTENGLPQYRDAEDSDTFTLLNTEDLVPLFEDQGGIWKRHVKEKSDAGITYIVTRFRPRIEGSFARIERWENKETTDTHWRTISGDNVHSYYGLTEESRVVNPNAPTNVFRWLLCRAHDDKGNIAIYHYKKEDFAEVPTTLSEKNRIGNCTQVYLKTVLYGNKQPYYLGDPDLAEDKYLFKVVFDYGEHDQTHPIAKDIDVAKHPWQYRQDPFSSYRAGFEIRTYRRCCRVMLFHCFDVPELPLKPYLVRSLELTYQDALELRGAGKNIGGFSYLVKARQYGHKWDPASTTYSSKHLPDFDLSYQQHEWNSNIEKVTSADATHAPVGVDDRQYLWIDLFSEGISGILTEQAGGWFYKSNLGNGNFSRAKAVAPKPSFSGLTTGQVAIKELKGDGIKYLVQYESEPRGFFKLTDADEWEPFRNFSFLPNLNFLDPNLRTIDLNGDGRADLLVTEDDFLRWYPGAGELGFEVSQTLTKALDEEKGPTLIFADQAQSIFLADFSGDGLTDIVRVRNGEICYWPNLGYGRFGAKVSMENAPLFDHSDKFNPRYLRLADIDGSGTADIIYLGKNDFRIWLNLNGNAWTPESQVIPAFPELDSLANVAVLDFLGSGTACIVYSSPLAQFARQPLQYIDLMGSKKPHLLVSSQNNCGKEVSIEYKSSTHFYLEDKQAGRKWTTKLPFPVHCISRVRVEDKIRETVFTNSYRYSHGYFDHEEREFRGFARVEQIDTEDFSQFKINVARNVVEEDLHQPPVKTVSWFHTGAFLGNDRILHQCKEEYFKNSSFAEYDLPEPVVASEMTAEELREALRACKGLPLRSEVYANDNSSLSLLPYSASQSTFEIRMVQPKQKNHFGSFLIIPSESVSYTYERNPADPRRSHSFVLETDELGNDLKSASVVYPRVSRPSAPNAIPDQVWQEQSKLHVVYRETLYTKDIDEDDAYRKRVGFESKAYEISGITLAPVAYLEKKKLFDSIKAAADISFEDEFSDGFQKRLFSHQRVYFLNDNLNGALPLGTLSNLGIGHKSFQLAFTKQLVPKYYGTKVTPAMFTDAGYLHSEGDENWWVHSGTAIYAPNPKANFFSPIGSRDIFGNESFVEYDNYTLLTISATDAIGNKVAATNDYRTLAPILITDPNLNRSAVETDELGFVFKSAVMGKEGVGEGDSLADPTTRMEYDLFNWQNHRRPNFAHTFNREQHGPANPRWQESYAYSDGGGSVILSKVQAEPGKAKRWNSITKRVEEMDADPRWIGNGRTILNNKGNPVKQYEPYFSTTFEYEHEDALVETGVTSVNYYDPAGRNIRTEYPNGTFSKIEHDAWHLKGFDVNDTVKDSQWYAERGSPDPVLVPEPNDPEQRAAWLAAKHHNTPGTVHTDSLGKTIYEITDFGNGRTTSVRSETDLTGRSSKVFDQLGRNVSEDYTNLLGAHIYGKTAEKGERWNFSDAMGRVVKIWDNDLREFRSSFDKLHRPVSTFAKERDKETLFRHVVYGDLLTDATQRNLRGRGYQLYDQAGVITLTGIDFKGNITRTERRLARDYGQSINWSTLEGLTDIADSEAAAAPLLELEVFSSSTVFDALNRPILLRLPDNSVVEPTYNQASLLDLLRVKIRGEGNFITFLEKQDYDAKGHRQFAQYGNGLTTKYSYDPKSFRLVKLLTKKLESSDAQSYQNLSYTFDPSGNIIYSRDDGQQTNYFRNEVVKAETKFEYDGNYQMIRATGREHAGLGGNTQRDNNDLPYFAQLPHHNDLNAVRHYTENYQYDDCGNITSLQHIAAGANWTQRYRYEYQDDASNKTNRLKSTSLPGDADNGPYSGNYQHDPHGNMTRLPHLSELDWNFMDQLSKVNLGGGGFAFYVYGPGGSRIRKVVQRPGSKRTERIYLGPVEIYREYRNGTKKLERSTFHVFDNTGHIAQIDTKLLDEDRVDLMNPVNSNLIRYHYTNHIGSSTIETDEFGTVISYEEYHPYGTSSYRSSKSNVDLSLKRYRFCGKERDDETGLFYFQVRYYAAWLGRWTSADPAGYLDGLNLYRYCGNSPAVFSDPSGSEHVYQIGPPFDRDVHTNTPAARRRLEGALTGREVQEDGVTYRINRPVLEWRGRRTGWYFVTGRSDISIVTPSSEITFEDELIVASPPPNSARTAEVNAESAPSAVPAESPSQIGGRDPPNSASGDQNSQQQPGTGNATQPSTGQRRFFTSSFFRGLVVGLAVTVAVIAVVATGGAALAAIAPAAAASIAASGVGTGLAIAGGAVAAANIVQSVRQRDLFNNRISEEQANYNLGLGVGSLAGGAFAGPISGGTSRTIQGLSQGAEGGTGLFTQALAGGGTFGGTISTPVAATAPIAIPGAIGAGAGSTVLMMSGKGSGGDDDDFAGTERVGRGGRNRPANNQSQNEQVRALVRKYNLTRDEQRQFHDYIQGEDLDYAGLEEALRGLFPNKILGP